MRPVFNGTKSIKRCLLCCVPTQLGLGLFCMEKSEAAQNSDGRYRLLVEAITDYAIYMLDREVT